LESPCKMLKGAGQFKLVGKGKQKALFQVKWFILKNKKPKNLASCQEEDIFGCGKQLLNPITKSWLLCNMKMNIY
jgi:hypothetical protein